MIITSQQELIKLLASGNPFTYAGTIYYSFPDLYSIQNSTTGSQLKYLINDDNQLLFFRDNAREVTKINFRLEFVNTLETQPT